MIDAYPIALFSLTGIIWLGCAIQNSRLLRSFEARFPEQAKKDIPYSFSNMRHPEKLFYFFRKKSLPLLKSDSRIWSLRQQFKYLLILSFTVPILGFSILATYALAQIYG